MTAQTFDTAVLKEFGETARDHAARQKVNRESSAEISQEKVAQYARLTSQIWGMPVTGGKLSKTNRAAIAEAMAKHANIVAENGVGKRLLDGAVRLSHQRKSLLKQGDQSPPASMSWQQIEATLINNGFTNESQLRNALFPNAGKTEIDKVVDKFVGSFSNSKDKETGEYFHSGIRTGNNADEFDALISALHERKRIADQVADAVKRGAKEAEALAKILANIE